jgi:hypothetical protein
VKVPRRADDSTIPRIHPCSARAIVEILRVIKQICIVNRVLKTLIDTLQAQARTFPFNFHLYLFYFLPQIVGFEGRKHALFTKSE